MEDPALWTAGTPRLQAVLRAADSPSLSEAVAKTTPERRRSMAVAASLAGPIEVVLALGADDRVVPTSGRNSYRMPLADEHPRLRASSCTATPPDAFALSVAERWREDLLDRTLDGQQPVAEEWHAGIAHRLIAAMGLDAEWAERVVLSPSGTDVASLLTTLVQGAHGRGVSVITVGAREAGSGTLPAAGLSAFRDTAAYSIDLHCGAPLPGTAPDRVRVTDVELRDAAGRVRRASDVEAEIEAHIEYAVECDDAVLVHVMGGSKTGLCCPGPEWVRAWRTRTPHVRMVLDAAQLRLARPDLLAYLDAGASVLVTGSKALSAPPFCGALLLDEALAADAADFVAVGEGLPSGLSRSVSRADLPPFLSLLGRGLEEVNVGLHARWHVALTEWERYLAVPAPERRRVVNALLTGWRRELDRVPGVHVLSPYPGACPTIVSLAVADADGWMGKQGLAEAYARIVESPGVYIGQPVELATGAPAVLRLAVGAATVTRLLEDAERVGSLDRAVADVVGVTVDCFARVVPVGAVEPTP
ncbi:MAG TPA: hypothetical protein VJ976_04505 [Ornithinimicrobium sp.]|uniref:hypothetical protein n=1 Tax=Ornithinimicrobium sp. TaxID=1977084 RepID=UPI002B48FC4E|nr:hypothetical protein [Ornithinimicrobium sp.]HKJ11636.1 hypothetical protein [Ornithinimicrobium sp.]